MKKRFDDGYKDNHTTEKMKKKNSENNITKRSVILKFVLLIIFKERVKWLKCNTISITDVYGDFL